MDRIRLVIVGASGKMGSLLCRLVDTSHCDEFDLVGAVVDPGNEAIGRPAVPGTDSNTPIIASAFDGDECDAVVDFSTPDGTMAALSIAQRCNAALLIATTGHTEAHRGAIQDASGRIPILLAPNTSVGVAVSLDLIERAVNGMGTESRIEIVEAHHRHKRDAPSGTALAMGRAAENAGARMNAEQFHSLRGGDVVGEHAVRIFGSNEYLEIRHVAISRELFATGALKGIRWLVARAGKPGLYGMRETIGA